MFWEIVGIFLSPHGWKKTTENPEKPGTFFKYIYFLTLDIFTFRASFGLYTHKYIKCISNSKKIYVCEKS